MQKIVFHATFGAKLGAKVGDTEANGVAKAGIDFADETLGAKLGAKVGDQEAV